ncbi:MAG: Xaa-Pro peptidase family protein [Geminicoccaceae bacterium]
MDERQARAAEAVRAAGADWGVLASVDGVAYASGHVVPVEAGPSPFAGGPTLVLIGADGTLGIVCANVEAAAAKASRAEVTEVYEGYAFDHGVDYQAGWREAVGRLAKRLGLGGRLAAERGFLPKSLDGLLAVDNAPDLTPHLRRARATKTGAELATLARCAEAVAIGQRVFLETARAGRSELAVFADVRCAMEEFAGCRVPITGDFLSGVERTAGFTGWPVNRTIQAGDPVMADLAPRIDGYWGDSCGTTCVGAPSAAYERLFRTSKAALEHAVEFVRPGRTAAEVDAEMRAFVGREGFAYPHHTGHSIGTAVHEWPRLVPYEQAVLEPDMVLLVEPGCYDPEVGGVRSEYMLRVTRDGAEVMHRFEHRLSVEAGA